MVGRSFRELQAIRERIADERKALHARESALDQLEGAKEPILQYELVSGTRVSIGGLFGRRLDITCAGGNPWAEAEGITFLTLGMLSVFDLAELLEIRAVVEAWREGALHALPLPETPFARWACPPGFHVAFHPRPHGSGGASK